MRFHIDKNLEAVAAAMVAPKPVEDVAVELCERLRESGLLKDEPETWGGNIYEVTGPQYISDICAVLAKYLYDDETRSIPCGVFDAFGSLIVLSGMDCPHCGGELEFIDVEGHELADGDYFTPNSWEIDKYVYECRKCGKITKTDEEL